MVTITRSKKFRLFQKVIYFLAISGIISNEKKIAEKLSPEQALRLLNDKLDFGMITEEEYQAQRNEIISKL